MGTIKFIVLKKTHLDFLYGFMHGFLYTNMVVPVVASFWGFLSKFIAFVFGSILGYLFRSSPNKPFAENDSGACSDSNCDELKERRSSDDLVDRSNEEAENDSGDCSDSNCDELKDRRSSDHVDRSNEEAENSSFVASSSKYEFLYGNDFSGFIEEPKAESYTVHEFYVGSYDHADFNDKILVSSDSAGGDIGKFEVETEDVTNEEKTEDCGENHTVEKVIKDRETEESIEEKTEELEKVLEKEPEESALRFSFNWDFEKYVKQEDVFEEIAKESVELEKPKIEEEEYIFDEKTEESVENHVIASDIEVNGDHDEAKFDNFFESPTIDMYLVKWNLEKEEAEKDGDMIFSKRNVVGVESITHEAFLTNRQSYAVTDGQKNEENMEHEIRECNSNFNISDSDEEFIELEPMSEKLRVMGETLSGKVLSFDDEDTESMASTEEDEEEEEEDDDDDELMEQLRMEMKMARTGGLPTILEESCESPKMVEEQLGPLKIDEKYEHKDHIAEIQKVYKGYSDKMKKLDILNSQTMHAISLLQLKDPVRVSSTSGKSSAAAIKSLLSWSFKQRRTEADPVMKLISDLHMDFETVYVGQVCLSWETLHWQYEKLKKLSECDSFGTHQYNQVAGEFQRFQVLVQRFLEDEPFQNRPRVENYTNNRCKVRRLLQVPVIKDDCSKYKLEDGVSNEMLTDMIEESMHVFWEFLRADKEDANATSKTPQQAKVAPHDPIDLELLMDVRTDLLKKEKRFKEIQRSTSCILKKIQRQQQQEDEGNVLDEALLIAQVELKLVSRVLSMLKISTDQLFWCHEKLRRINFRSRKKIEIEPSFTLFPC